MRIAVDSQCFSYLFDAWTAVVQPVGHLAEEKIALFRCYLYLPGVYQVTPTVLKECRSIPDEARRSMHREFLDPLFEDMLIGDLGEVTAVADRLNAHHYGTNDCRIVAEAIVGGADVLLSYDSDLIKHLSTRIEPLRLLRPTEFWSDCALPRGAKPNKVPSPGGMVAGRYSEPNPLALQSWWRW